MVNKQRQSGVSKNREKPTMADVARKAGVSAMTVSRALKGDGLVVEETRKRIMQAVDDLGYVLDLSAGALSSKRTGFVAVLIPSVNNSNFSETVHGLSEVLSTEGIQILFGYTDYSTEREEQLIETMLQRRPEGIIVTGGTHTVRSRTLLQRAAIPVVEMWDLPADPICHSVGFSNAQTVEDLMKRLVDRGYRNIGFIGSNNPEDYRGNDRRLGYEQAVGVLGLNRAHTVSIGSPSASIALGGQAVVQLVEEWPEVDAVVCVSDLTAFGAVMECHRRGWDVPGRLAVAGFGDFELSQYCYPAITTVSVDCAEIGRQAGQVMLDAIRGERDGNPLEPRSITMKHNVIDRESA